MTIDCPLALMFYIGLKNVINSDVQFEAGLNVIRSNQATILMTLIDRLHVSIDDYL